jgi:hypothetical protein
MNTYTWDIEKIGYKTADGTTQATDLTLATGESFDVHYEVTVTPHLARATVVTGTISLTNNQPYDVTVDGLPTDALSDGTLLTVVCPDTSDQPITQWPQTVPANGGTFHCTYSTTYTGTPPAGLTNTAHVIVSEVTYTVPKDPFPVVVNPSVDVHKCIDVTDDHGTPGNTADDTTVGSNVCAGTNLDPITIPSPRYILRVGPYSDCGNTVIPFTNIATFTARGPPAGYTGSDDWTVDISVPCVGCTLTQGYWKTHSLKGPAPYDDNWAKLPNGAETPFFVNPPNVDGTTWYSVYWTPPKGDAYYQLAHQYEAAKLNILNGASSTSAVTTSITWAENTVFTVFAPKGKKVYPQSLVKDMRTNAATLASYNEGTIGPGHCDEQVPPGVTD